MSGTLATCHPEYPECTLGHSGTSGCYVHFHFRRDLTGNHFLGDLDQMENTLRAFQVLIQMYGVSISVTLLQITTHKSKRSLICLDKVIPLALVVGVFPHLACLFDLNLSSVKSTAAVFLLLLVFLFLSHTQLFVNFCNSPRTMCSCPVFPPFRTSLVSCRSDPSLPCCVFLILLIVR